MRARTGWRSGIDRNHMMEARMSDDGQTRTVRVRIAGRVQGVSFRFWTQETASALALTGWVRNCRDGSVEALFSGCAQGVTEMLIRCHEGPPAAAVTSVDVLEEGA